MIHRWLIIFAISITSLNLGGCVALVVGGAAVGAAAVINDRRTGGTIVDDQSIKLKISSALGKNEELVAKAHVNVTSFNGVVLLTGETPTEQLREKAGEVARHVEKVRRVHNEIEIAAPSAFVARSSDSLITSKVKAALIGIDASRVKVVTENGTVYLMGLLKREEADAVVKQVQQVGGVQRVVKVFEYLD